MSGTVVTVVVVGVVKNLAWVSSGISAILNSLKTIAFKLVSKLILCYNENSVQISQDLLLANSRMMYKVTLTDVAMFKCRLCSSF